MEILPKILSSSEIYGQLADGPLKGIPISGVSNIYIYLLFYELFSSMLTVKNLF